MPLKQYRERVVALVGEQIHDVRVASVCSGMVPKSVTFKELNVKHAHIFSCDFKEACYQWMSQHCDQPPLHHFLDMREMFGSNNNMRGVCANHEFGYCNARPSERLHILIAGISCRPNSTARTGRFNKGTASHPDSDLPKLTIAGIVTLEPYIVLVENVYGFAMPESKLDGQSPLQRFLVDMRQAHPQYHWITIVMHGNTFGVMRRRRLYILGVHSDAGGMAAAENVARLVQARLHSNI